MDYELIRGKYTYDKNKPLNFNDVQNKAEYLYTSGPGQSMRIVTVSAVYSNSIMVKIKDGVLKGKIVRIDRGDTNKKLYNLIPAEPRFQVNDLNTAKQKLTQPDAMTYPNVTYPEVPTLQHLAQKSLNSEDRQKLKNMDYDYLNQNPGNIPKYSGNIPVYPDDIPVYPDDNSTHGGRIKSKKTKRTKKSKRTKRTKKSKRTKRFLYK
jgi:hypothetical protein